MQAFALPQIAYVDAFCFAFVSFCFNLTYQGTITLISTETFFLLKECVVAFLFLSFDSFDLPIDKRVYYYR